MTKKQRQLKKLENIREYWGLTADDIKTLNQIKSFKGKWEN